MCTNPLNPGWNERWSSEPRELSRAVLEQIKSVVYLVDSNLRLSYCNPAWDKFARANGGRHIVSRRILGASVMDVIPDPLSNFYSKIFEHCLERNEPADFDYECSSAERYRLMHMNILPLAATGELAFISSVRVEFPHGRRTNPASDIYYSSLGFVTLCCSCRRTLRHDGSDVWDWVPQFVESPNYHVTHGMCSVCVPYFYSRYIL